MGPLGEANQVFFPIVSKKLGGWRVVVFLALLVVVGLLAIDRHKATTHLSRRMNIFRLIGDLSHVLAILILLGKIWRQRNVAGVGLSLSLSLSFSCPMLTACTLVLTVLLHLIWRDTQSLGDLLGERCVVAGVFPL
jgi:hypothetical protein